MKLKDKLAFALDISSSKEAIDMVNLLKGHVGYFKIGPQLFIRCGPDIVKRVQDRGAKVFLDLKLYDIPNTVSKSVESAISLGVDFLSIHSLAGTNVLHAAKEAAGKELQLLAITVLTSAEKRIDGDMKNALSNIYLSKINGLVCSPLEAGWVKKQYNDMFVVTPGIRLLDDSLDDQNRVDTPHNAIANGSDMLVVGRTIRNSKDPVSTVEVILEQINGGLKAKDAALR